MSGLGRGVVWRARRRGGHAGDDAPPPSAPHPHPSRLPSLVPSLLSLSTPARLILHSPRPHTHTHARAPHAADDRTHAHADATQGATCEVLWEREGFCTSGRFAQLKSMRAAVLPMAALLNLTRTPLSPRQRAGAAAAALGINIGGVGGGAGGAQSLGKRYEGAPSNMWLLLDPEFFEDAATVAKHAVESTAAAADALIASSAQGQA